MKLLYSKRIFTPLLSQLIKNPQPRILLSISIFMPMVDMRMVVFTMATVAVGVAVGMWDTGDRGRCVDFCYGACG